MDALINFISALAILALCGLLGARVKSHLASRVDLDGSLLYGLSGLIALGGLGTLFLFVGLLSTKAIPIVALLLLALALIGTSVPKEIAGTIVSFRQNGPRKTEWLFVIALKLCAILAFIGVLAPPDTLEWDSLAYHLAVPKLWLAQGHISYIPYIHQSNFPGAFDYLYLFGLSAGYPGAKAFVLAAATFGGFAIFGLTRQLYGRKAAWWASLAFSTVPVLLWLSGTAYIDVPNGLCAGIAIALAALYCKTLDKKHLMLAAVMLGLATASKYTGLQTIGAVGLILLLTGIKRKESGEYFKSAVVVGIVALVIACPWYIKNELWAGNPVYPFFYSKLGGRNFSAPQAEEYTREQSSFGVGTNDLTGHHDFSQLGAAIFGLGYQPGRYINPAQQAGGGFPTGAVGATVLCALVAWAFSGRNRAFEMFSLAGIGVSLLLWFFLSQQSRYIVTLTIPLSVMLGGGVVRLRGGPWLAAIAALQGVYSFALIGSQVTWRQLPVVFGQISQADYQQKGIAFYDAAQFINQTVPQTGRVALYDEVFGDLLNVPYYWANPGHCNLLPYSSMRDGHDYVEALRNLKDNDGNPMPISYVYINLSPSVHDPELSSAWIAAMGLNGRPQPWPPEIVRKYDLNGFEQHFVPLIADAVAHKDLRFVQAIHSGILFQVAPSS